MKSSKLIKLSALLLAASLLFSSTYSVFAQDVQPATDVVVQVEAQPEEAQPEVTDPGVTQPEETQPEVTDPGVTQPEETQPESTDSRVTETEEEQKLKQESYDKFRESYVFKINGQTGSEFVINDLKNNTIELSATINSKYNGFLNFGIGFQSEIFKGKKLLDGSVEFPENVEVYVDGVKVEPEILYSINYFAHHSWVDVGRFDAENNIGKMITVKIKDVAFDPISIWKARYSLDPYKGAKDLPKNFDELPISELLKYKEIVSENGKIQSLSDVLENGLDYPGPLGYIKLKFNKEALAKCITETYKEDGYALLGLKNPNSTEVQKVTVTKTEAKKTHNNPQTGDESAVFLNFAMLISSAAGLVVTRKRK